MKTFFKFKIGDKVSFDFFGKIHYGTIRSISSDSDFDETGKIEHFYYIDEDITECEYEMNESSIKLN